MILRWSSLPCFLLREQSLDPHPATEGLDPIFRAVLGLEPTTLGS
jgi:hypothetical protein